MIDCKCEALVQKTKSKKKNQQHKQNQQQEKKNIKTHISKIPTEARTERVEIET